MTPGPMEKARAEVAGLCVVVEDGTRDVDGRTDVDGRLVVVVVVVVVEVDGLTDVVG